MEVQGHYFIQAIDIDCDCGYNEYIQLEDCNFETGDEYNSTFICPECNKKIDFDLYVDDEIVEELSYYEYDDDLKEGGE